MPTPRPDTFVTFSAVEKSREKDQVSRLRAHHARGLLGRNQSFFHGLAANPVAVEPSAVVGALDDDLSAFVIARSSNRPSAGLPTANALLGLLDAGDRPSCARCASVDL